MFNPPGVLLIVYSLVLTFKELPKLGLRRGRWTLAQLGAFYPLLVFIFLNCGDDCPFDVDDAGECAIWLILVMQMFLN